MSDLAAVLKADGARILRDPFLLFMVVAPFAMGTLVKYALPYFQSVFIDSFDLGEYFALIICIVAITPSLYIGAVLSLQIIEEQEENVLSAIAVTPLSFARYFLIRLVLYTLLAFFVITCVQHIIGISGISSLNMVILSFCMSLQVPFLALLVATYADNQIEGMVALKATGFILMPALAMFFVDDYWHVLCGLVPGYWPVIAYFKAFDGNTGSLFYLIACVVGIVYQLLAIWIVYSFFAKKRI